MINLREHQSMIAYINFIRNKSVESANLAQRQTIIQNLCPYIANEPNDGNGYRQGVNGFLEHINKADWNFVLMVIREYFPFWTNNIKLVAALTNEYVLENNTSQWQVLSGNLATIWAELDHAHLNDDDIRAIKAYSRELKQKNAEQSLIDTRVNLIKLLLTRLQNISEKNPTLFRKATDATVLIFEQKETRYLFLSVVREFYCFWIDKQR